MLQDAVYDFTGSSTFCSLVQNVRFNDGQGAILELSCARKLLP
jgi:hypothetical protein